MSHVKPPAGIAPAVVLINPKFPHNVGAALRACSCYALKQLWWTGHRVPIDGTKGERLPREERMRGYKDVEMVQHDFPFDQFASDVVVVGIELVESAMSLVDMSHFDKMVYVFGPEDGSIPKAYRNHCHLFAAIPTHHCLNLATAVASVLYDRRAKRIAAGEEPRLPIAQMLKENRGFTELPTPFDNVNWNGK